MKPIFTLIAATLIAASCSTEIKQAPESAVVDKVKTTVAPKPKPYPLETCLVSNEDLDEMDERISTVHKGQIFEFCCKPCLVKFRKDPEKYVAKLAVATKR